MSYHEQWRKIAENVASYYEVWAEDHPHTNSNGYGYRECFHCCRSCSEGNGHHVALFLHRLGRGLQFLANLDELFPKCSDYYRQEMFHSWRSSIEENINLSMHDRCRLWIRQCKCMLPMSFITKFLIQSSSVKGASLHLRMNFQTNPFLRAVSVGSKRERYSSH